MFCCYLGAFEYLTYFFKTIYGPPPLSFSGYLLSWKEDHMSCSYPDATMAQGKKLFKKYVQTNTFEKVNIIELKKPKQ